MSTQQQHLLGADKVPKGNYLETLDVSQVLCYSWNVSSKEEIEDPFLLETWKTLFWNTDMLVPTRFEPWFHGYHLLNQGANSNVLAQIKRANWYPGRTKAVLWSHGKNIQCFKCWFWMDITWCSKFPKNHDWICIVQIAIQKGKNT